MTRQWLPVCPRDAGFAADLQTRFKKVVGKFAVIQSGVAVNRPG